MNTKRIIGTIILLFIGFLAFVLIAGLGFLIGMMLSVLSFWQVIVGTLLGYIAILMYLLGNIK